MANLVDLIHIIPPDRDEEPEDIFASAPGLIFTDDTRNHHGEPRSVIVYKSRRFGHIELRTADPEREDERQLFSHYLWNAGINMAELVSSVTAKDARWSVKGERVLELGAGVIICPRERRAKLANFFEVAVEEGMETEEIYEEDVGGVRRTWQTERDGGREDVMERKRWLVISRLKRRLADCTLEGM
ncbi:hypothetical protein B0A55_08473 [Friedmanniomyces simplex]|uniref:Uncharacterized protein n=1 Tax=Friedmanniomyces simplex TaxID=329884 RepID=A0A4U0WYM1_9PEZI|nr:hypothetical protein B0A55_08473 [Friedmanniomyces simplex]